MGKLATSLPNLTMSEVAFVGIDYHKKFSVVCLGDARGGILGTVKLFNDREAVGSFFSQLKHARCAMESCRGYEWLLVMLLEMGIDVSICNPFRIKLIVESRCKTDKVDSKAIMQLLAIGFLPTCYIATAEEKRLRELLRWRASLVHSVTRTKGAIVCLIDKENLGLAHKDLFTVKGREHLRLAPLSSDHRILLDKQLDLLEELERRLAIEDKWAKTEAKSRPQATALQTIPGFGPLVSLIYLSEVGDITRFRSAPQVSSYAGLVTSVFDSADTHRSGAITKQGSKHLRSVLIQAAWIAIQKVPALRQKFGSIAFRRGRNKAITAIARKLCEIAFRILRDGTNFDESKLAQS